MGFGRYSVQFASPLLVAAVLVPAVGGERRPWSRRLAAASLLLGPGLMTWRKRRARLDPARFTLASIADDVAYGAGVWYGSIRQRSLSAVRPVIAWRPQQSIRPPDRSSS